MVFSLPIQPLSRKICETESIQSYWIALDHATRRSPSRSCHHRPGPQSRLTRLTESQYHSARSFVDVMANRRVSLSSVQRIATYIPEFVHKQSGLGIA